MFCSITDLPGMLIRNNPSLARILLVKPASHSGRGGSRKTDGEGVNHTFLTRKPPFLASSVLFDGTTAKKGSHFGRYALSKQFGELFVVKAGSNAMLATGAKCWHGVPERA